LEETRGRINLWADTGKELRKQTGGTASAYKEKGGEARRASGKG
jgi:hypothetical protein